MATKSETFIQKLQGADVKNALTTVMPKAMNYDRFMAMVVSQSKLKFKEHSKLVPSSILVCAYEAASLGLSFDPHRGEAHMVPYNCKIGKSNGKDVYGTIVQFQTGYRGLIKLCRNAGMKNIYAKVIYEKDTFDYWEDEEGQHFKYEPYFGEDRGKVKCAFSLAILEDDTKDLKVIHLETLKKAEKASKSKTGPWKNWKEEMQMKTAIRRHCKTLPQDTSLARAAFLDEQMEELGKPEVEVPKGLHDIVDADYIELSENIKKEQHKENTSSKPEVTETVLVEPEKEKKKEEAIQEGPKLITRDEFETQIATLALQAGQKDTDATNEFISANSGGKFKSVSDIPEDGFSSWLDMFQVEAESKK